MRKTLSKITQRLIRIIPTLAMILAVQSVVSTCFFCLYQPDVPDELLKK